MSMKFTKIPEPINQQARDWYTLMQSSEVTEQDRQQLADWLSEDTSHNEAYQQVEAIWQGLGEMASSSQAEALQRSLLEQNSVQRIFAAVINSPLRLFNKVGFQAVRYQRRYVMAFMVAVLAVMFLLPETVQEVDIIEEHYATRVGEIERITLADGSEVVLGAKSEINTRITSVGRFVELVNGEAFFDVATDPGRPFRVSVNDISVQVVGTQFNVRKRLSGVSVAVEEGVVNVAKATLEAANAAAQTPLVLTAGQQVVKPKGKAFESVKAISAVELGAWRNGRLIYRNTNLIDVISDANRYFDGSISLQAAALAKLKVTATLRTDQVALLPDMLSQSLPIVVRRNTGNCIVLERKITAN